MGKTLLNAFLITLMVIGLAFVGNAHYCTAESDVSASIPSANMASGGNGNLELTMTIDKESYSLGEPVNLTLTITNISNQTISFEHTGLDFDFQVFNDTNNLVYQWSNFKAIAQFIAIVPLPVGENMSTNFTWLQTCNFNASVQGDPVSPGIYNIIGKTGPTYGIQTTPIQLTIGVTPTTAPTPLPTTTPTQTPQATTLPATTNNGSTVDLAITGNITSAQISNVTIATLQSTSSSIVSFTVTGENGTTGFGNITIPISAVLYGTTPTIYIDGQPAQDQGYAQDSNNYYVWYATHFSTHEVSIVFTAKSLIPEFPLSAILSLFIILAVSVSVMLIPKNRKIYKN
ncbi:MAG: BsuPI-related putative proteinase inhibitor [Candidatus Bathyarchaeia archaeon]|jgi:hypothetical protein